MPASAASVLARQLRDVFEMLNQASGHLSPQEAERLGNEARDLSAALLARGNGSAEVRGARRPADARPGGRAVRIGEFIQAHLGDPDLSPSQLAAAHLVSLRYLHRLFQAEGTTVCAVIRRRRLDGSRAELLDSDRPIHEIAARWGFRRPADFSRLFRAAYGMSPTEYRASGREDAL
jgi:AraC-like DNA-binding protein